MKAYKGFNPDMTCSGFQFEEGKTYTEDKADLCNSGFHACEHPIGTFGYYAPANSIYHEVELDETTDQKENNTKRVGKKIKIGVRLSIAQMAQAAVDFVFEKSHEGEGGHATGYQGAASATGDRGAASATGEQSIACAHGINGKAKASLGNWIVLSEWKNKVNLTTYAWKRKNVKAFLVDGDKIKEDIYYTLKDGKAVEVDNE